MKYVVLILDGAAGWPLDELGGRTTLAAAHAPNLDAMARTGLVGLATTVPAGMEPSSAAACMSILGYDPARHSIGRGAIEAASLGIDLGPNDVAFRCNLVSVADGVMKDYSAGHIKDEDSHPLIASLDEALGAGRPVPGHAPCEARFFPGLSYRHILRLTGCADTANAACTPPHDIPWERVAEHLPRGPGSDVLRDLMERSKAVLAAAPVNEQRTARGEPAATQIWLFWPGVEPADMPTFAAVSGGLSSAMTSAVDLLGGLAAIFGIDRLQIAGVTDGPDNDYAAQAEGALAALASHDLVIVHVESPDEMGHMGDAAAKVKAIEDIDRLVVARLLARQSEMAKAGDELRILALPDHPTPVAIRTHAAEPVPFVMCGPRIDQNEADAYSEIAAESTGVAVNGWELLAKLVG